MVGQDAVLARPLERAEQHVEEREGHQDATDGDQCVREPRGADPFIAHSHQSSSPARRLTQGWTRGMMKMITKSAMAIALAVPQAPNLNACWYISNAATFVEFTGPPSLVMTRMRANDCRPAMHCVIKTKSREGRRSGSVMPQKLGQLFAPSISAASYTLRSIALMPAVRMSTAAPIEAHACTTATEGSAIFGSERKPTKLMWRTFSNPLMGPDGWYIIFHTLPIATTVATTGRKYRKRQNPWKRRRSMHCATSREPATASTTESAANTRVLTRIGDTKVPSKLRMSE